MTDTPFPRLNPEQLRQERQNVDLGEADIEHDRVTHSDDAAQRSALDESTPGVIPPAR